MAQLTRFDTRHSFSKHKRALRRVAHKAGAHTGTATKTLRDCAPRACTPTLARGLCTVYDKVQLSRTSEDASEVRT